MLLTFFFFFDVRYVILMLLLYTFFINLFIICHRSFPKILTGYKFGTNSRAQFHPVLGNIHTLRHDRQLRASYLILRCMPSYTSYQDSSGTLMVGSPLLSYLNVRLPGFLLNRLTSGEARHQGPRRVRQGSLELVHDGSGDTVFWGRVVHIPIEALILEAPIIEAPIAEALVLINLTIGIVRKCTKALDCWFPAVQPIGSQAAP